MILLSLVFDGCDDLRVAVADVHYADSTRKINQFSTVYIIDDSSSRLACEVRGDVERSLRNKACPELRQKLTGFGTRS